MQSHDTLNNEMDFSPQPGKLLFSLSAYDVVRIMLGGVLLAAAVLKFHQLVTEPVAVAATVEPSSAVVETAVPTSIPAHQPSIRSNGVAQHLCDVQSGNDS